MSPERRSVAPAPSGKDLGDRWHSIDALLVRVGRGSVGAFGRLYDATAGMIFGLATALLRDADQAEQVTQAVFREIWRLASRFDPSKQSGGSWIVALTFAGDRFRGSSAPPTFTEAERLALDNCPNAGRLSADWRSAANA